MNNKDIIIIILIIFNIFSLLLGFLLGKISHNNGVLSITNNRPKSFLNQQSDNNTNKIEIDSKKIVTNINTSGLEKKYTKLGEEKESKDNISLSVDKLKNLKR